MEHTRSRLKEAKRIVVKVGTSTLTYDTGKLNLLRIEQLVREIADLTNSGKEILLVTSGAIAAGADHLNLPERPKAICEKQAAAAIGQGVLMHIYEKIFAEYGKVVGQVLLTKENSLRHNQYTNSRNALLALLQMGAIPIINENDAVTVDEIKIGDNDTLSAMVATLIDADALVILSDIDGLYNDNPNENKDAILLDEITQITPDIEEMAHGAGSSLGTGGMATKIEAAKIAMSCGVTMVIAPGAAKNILHDVLSGKKIGTIFPAKTNHLRLRKSWLAFGKRLSGDIFVDEGCAEAMVTKGSSLLAAGIVRVEGDFAARDTVRVIAPDGREIARGTINYDSAVIEAIRGKRTEDFAGMLCGKVYEEAIHRDNMVIMG